MKGIFVNADGPVDYAEAIVSGRKIIETRSRDMLKNLVHERVAIVRTRRGKKPEVVGHAFIMGKMFLSADTLEIDRNFTLIPKGSKYDCTGKGKWGYFLEDATPCYPYPLPDNAVRHGLSWCEFEEV